MMSDKLEDSPWTRESEFKRPLYIVIAGDRGLAGGYNANIFRLTAALTKDQEAKILPLGKKAIDHYRHRNANILTTRCCNVSEVSVGNSLEIGEDICDKFIRGEYDSVFVVYTKFVSMISQTPVYEQLLPLEKPADEGKGLIDPIFVGKADEILDKIIPQYVGGVLYSVVCESLASESAARRTAMNAANKNAGEIIDTLVLKYNRARQAVITQEITEIVSGSEAL